MSIMTEEEYTSMTREAAEMLRTGNLQSAIDVLTRLVEGLMEPGPKAVQGQRVQANRLERTSSQLVDTLRWARDYPPAIALQERLVEYLPAMEESLRLSTANLRLESGTETEEGLAFLREKAAQFPDNYWYQISLANAYMYLEQFEQAEETLRRAAGMAQVRKIDRAMAYQYLFALLERQGRTDEAMAAWREASRLDSSLRHEMLSDVCRMLITWKKFSEAQQVIALDLVQARKLFFHGLAALGEDKPSETAADWSTLLRSTDPLTLKEGQDEYAEACLLMRNPTGAILALEKLVNEGQATCRRSVILGLAYAQQKNLEQAYRHLEIGLRLGDLERPRRTLPSGERRVFSEEARNLYQSVFLDPSINKRIAGYFEPAA